MIKLSFNLIYLLISLFLISSACSTVNENNKQNSKIKPTDQIADFNEIAQIIDIHGKVMLKKPDSKSWVMASKTSKISEGLEVLTSYKSYLKIQLKDKTMIEIGQLTHIKIDELNIIAPGASRNKVGLKLNLGKINANVTKSSGIQKSFTVSSPQGVASVRGTQETVSYYPHQGMTVSINEGLASVDGLNRSVLVSAGNTTTIAKKDPVSSFEKKESSVQTGSQGSNTSLDLLDKSNVDTNIDREKL